MANLNNKVYVFTSTNDENRNYNSNGVEVIRIKTDGLVTFRKEIVAHFSKLHAQIGFDVMEAADYGADGFFLKQAFPTLPYLVKLHSPSFLVKKFQNYHEQYIHSKNFVSKTKRFLKKIIFNKKNFSYNKNDDVEHLNVKLADHIISPSYALAKKISIDWIIPFSKMAIVQNPYVRLNHSDAGRCNFTTQRITFIGKLSVLKGILDLIDAIPKVLKKMPDLKFRFIGEDSFSPFEESQLMTEYLIQKTKKFAKNIELTGKVALDAIPSYLADTDIIICCSLWENYPTVILEALNAGRLVIGSKVGGIPEIITHKQNGLIVKSKNAKDIVKKICWVYMHINQAKKIAENGKLLLHQMHQSNKLQEKILNAYTETINKCKHL